MFHGKFHSHSTFRFKAELPIWLLFVLLGFSFTSTSAQKEANIWYFGRDGVGLDFNCIPPSVVTGHTMVGWEGVSTISDRETGKILFYTNGDQIYNRNNTAVQGGTYVTPVGQFFEPFNSVTQVLIIPKPGNPDQYYVLNTDAQAGKIQSADPSLNGMWAVQLNAAANGGLGEAIDRFSVYNPQFTTEKLLAVPHQNGEDIFVIGHEFDNANFFVFEVTNTGFPATPDIYSLGQNHDPIPGDFDQLNSLGELKASPDASLVASVVSGEGFIELFDFDNGTGAITNARLLASEPGAYGVSFSPNGSKLYVGTWNGQLYQFDLSLATTADIIASKILIYNYNGGSFASLKIGPDQRIYVSRYVGGPYAQDGGDVYLGVINDPDAAGQACSYVHDGIDLNGKKCNWGLNNVMERTTYEQIELEVNLGPDLILPCSDDPVLLDVTQECVQGYTWSDGSTGSTLAVDNSGAYSVTITYGNCTASDTVQVELNAENSVFLGPDLVLCAGESIVLDASQLNGQSYLWQDGSTGSTFTVSEPGTYMVTVDFGNCLATDSIVISESSDGMVDLGGDISTCNLPIILDASTPGALFYTWQDGSTASTYNVMEPGTYSVTVETPCGFSTDEVNIELLVGSALSPDDIQLPDAFTPNGDGTNDQFGPVIPTEEEFAFTSYSLQVFNRWGDQVFESFDPTMAWDGQLDGQALVMDVYVWVLQASLIDCEGREQEVVKKGDVTMVR